MRSESYWTSEPPIQLFSWSIFKQIFNKQKNLSIYHYQRLLHNIGTLERKEPLFHSLYFGRTLFCKICAFRHQFLANFKRPFSHHKTAQNKIAPKKKFFHFEQINFCSFEFTKLFQNSFTFNNLSKGFLCSLYSTCIRFATTLHALVKFT